jgi:signal transduction histidine kinase
MKIRPRIKKIYWLFILSSIVLSLAIGAAGYFVFQDKKEILREEEWKHLTAIGDSKVREIADWRKERIGDATVVFNNPFISQHIQNFLANPGSTPLGKKILVWISSLKDYLQYDSVLLLDANGTRRLSVPEEQRTIDLTTKNLALEALRTRKVVFSDFYRSEVTHAIYLNLIVPIFASRGNNFFPIGVLLLRIDPYKYLYPLLQSWPTSSHTAESLLIRRDGERGVFLNELRHRKNTALTLYFPVSESQLPAAMALRGEEGIMEGVDYRGVPVLAVVRRVPDTSWFLVSKVDQEEIYAPIRQQAWFIEIVVGLLIAGIGLGTGFLWRGQHLRARKREEEVLRRVNEELERRVEKRTEELQTINESLQREILERRQAEEGLKESEKQLRHLSSQLLTVQEKERKQIACEIHDGLGQCLTAIKFSTQNMVRQMEGEESKIITESLGATLPLIQEAIEEAKRIQMDLRPSTLDDLGILPTLSWFCRRFQSIYPGIHIEQEIAIEENEIPDLIKTVIYRVTQEALNNIAKHSKADLVQLRLGKTGSAIELIIKDNGEGFDLIKTLTTNSPHKGLGLSSMRERTELSGGSYAIESSPGSGTVIRVSWPLG